MTDEARGRRNKGEEVRGGGQENVNGRKEQSVYYIMCNEKWF